MAKLPTPKRLGGQTANANQRKGRAHEVSSATRFRAELVPGSGAGRVKGDVRKRNVFRLENKTTKNLSFPLSAALIDKLEKSVPMGSTEIPFMEVRVNDEGIEPKTVFVFPSWAMDDVIAAMEGLQDG